MDQSGKFKNEWSFLWASLGKWWSLMYGAFGLYASIDFAIHKWASVAFQGRWDSVPALRRIGWKESLIVGLAIAIVVTLRHTWKIVRGLQDRLDELYSDGPDIRLGYDTPFLGGLLYVQNLGPGMIYNVAVDGVRYGHFTAQLDPIPDVEANGPNEHFSSDNNTATQNQLIEAVLQSPESENFDWSKVISVTLKFDWTNLRREYCYELECWPFRNKVEFRFKGRMVCGQLLVSSRLPVGSR